jgi:hypothetical protein
MNVQTINDIYFYYYLLTKISEFYKNNVASYKTEKFTTRWNHTHTLLGELFCGGKS